MKTISRRHSPRHAVEPGRQLRMVPIRAVVGLGEERKWEQQLLRRLDALILQATDAVDQLLELVFRGRSLGVLAILAKIGVFLVIFAHFYLAWVDLIVQWDGFSVSHIFKTSDKTGSRSLLAVNGVLSRGKSKSGADLR
jgi:hypothetical protein